MFISFLPTFLSPFDIKQVIEYTIPFNSNPPNFRHKNPSDYKLSRIQYHVYLYFVSIYILYESNIAVLALYFML